MHALCLRTSLSRFVVLALAAVLSFGSGLAGVARAQVTPAGVSVHAGSTQQFSGILNGVPAANGFWYVNGTGDVGAMDVNGVYHAPSWPPSPNTVTIGYYWAGSTVQTTATVTSPVPQPKGVNVSSVYQLSTPVILYGNQFAPGATVAVNGAAMPVTYLSPSQLSLTIALKAAVTGPLTVTVTNPGPGSSSASISVPTSFSTSTISPASAQVHAGGTQQYTAQVAGSTPAGGYWYVNGTGNVGYMDASGVYHAPLTIPSPSTVTIGYYLSGTTVQTTATVVNPTPVVTAASVGSITQMSTPVVLQGIGFLPTSVISVQGRAMPTTLYASGAIGATVTLAYAERNGVTLTVTNPGPGSSTGSITIPSTFPWIGSISPKSVVPGWVTFSVTGTGYDANTRVEMDGRVMQTTLNSSTSITATGYLPAWNTATTTAISVVPAAGSVSTGTKAIAVTYPSTSYDAAARFTTQAAFGPRPAVVDWIQKNGMQAFLTEQFQQPALSYPSNVLPRFYLLGQVTYGGSMLRQRVALALSSFIDNQALTEEFQSYAPWEQTLETDAFGNYRQLMTDMVSNPRLADFLNLPGNVAASGSLHPNQNFPRELMQLFTIGTSMLNDDGSVQTDGNGRPLPAYDQNTVLDLSRAFTGWNFGPATNPAYTAYNIDWSQPLVAQNQYHDFGAKTLFGTVQLPAGQDAATDRTQALDAIFNHRNVPPFVATRLIGQLVKSNPTPAYVQRISAVFENDGKGVRGNLQAVVQAILLDPEARAGDTADVAETDGFLQDPLLWQTFLMSALDQTTFDGQAIYFPGELGQDWFHPVSIFAFYPPQYLLPGSAVNSPQFALTNNLSQLHRSQLTYGIVTGSVNGFGAAYQANSWLFTAFTTLPDLVTALNHQLYHGRMPAAVQSAILSYCSGISDPVQQRESAIFLAFNSDSYNVSH